MKINDVIVEAGVGQELWRRATMRPEQKRELEQMESMLVKLTKLPLEQVQKNSKDILKQYKELLNQNDDWEKTPIGRELALAAAIKPFYPELSQKIKNAYLQDKTAAQQQTAPAAQTQPAQTTTSITVPDAPEGYINTLDIAGMKYWKENDGNWMVYPGNMWPNDKDNSQEVTGADLDKLAPYIQAGKVKQEPYGTKKKKKK